MSEENKQSKKAGNEEETKLPKGETEPLEGTIGTDTNFGYLSKLVAYHSLKASAQAIGDQINKLSLPTGSKILVVDKLNFSEMDFALIWMKSHFALFEEKMDAQIKENESFSVQIRESKKSVTVPLKRSKSTPEASTKGATRSALGAISAVPGIISTIADIAGYFKVNYDIKDQDFTLDSDVISSIVTGKISSTHDVYINNFNIMDEIDESEMLKQFAGLILNRTRVETSKEALKDKEQAASAILESESIMKAFDAFVLSVTTVKEGEGQPRIVSATIREHIKEMGITHLLHLKISSAGGEAITQKRIFTSGHTAYIGGSTISYILAQRDGKVVSADMLVAFSELDYKISSDKSPEIRVVKLP